MKNKAVEEDLGIIAEAMGFYELHQIEVTEAE